MIQTFRRFVDPGAGNNRDYELICFEMAFHFRHDIGEDLRFNGEDNDVFAIDGVEVIGGYGDHEILHDIVTARIHDITDSDVFGLRQIFPEHGCQDCFAHVAAADKCDFHFNNPSL